MKLGVVILFGAFWFVVAVARAPEVPTAAGIGVDESWTMGLAATLQQGQVSGRDFYFTYGPLAQTLAALPIPFTSSRSAVSAFPLILISFWTASIVLFLAIVLLIERIDWKHAVLLLLIATGLNLFTEPNSFRPLSLLLCAVLLSRTLSQASRRKRRLGSILVGLSAVLAQLFTIELGIYGAFLTLFVLLIFAGFSTLRHRLFAKGLYTPQHYLEMLGCSLAAFLLGNLLISLAFYFLPGNSANGLFDYQRQGFEIMRGYNMTMGAPWELPGWQTAGLCLIGLYSIATVVFMARRSISEHYLPIILCVCSLISLKTALLRSDIGHITSAFGPLIFLFMMLGVYQYRNKWKALAWTGCLILLFAAWPWSGAFAFSDLLKVIRGDVKPIAKVAAFRAGRVDLNALLPNGFAEVAGTRPTPMLTFPYETYIAIALNKRLVVPTLQAYVASTAPLQESFVSRLEEWGNDLQVTYGIDGLGSGTIDSVQEVSRLPIIFEYLYRHFETTSAQSVESGFALMQRRPTPRDLIFADIPFDFREQSRRTTELHLHQATFCSLIRMNMAVEYPLTSMVGRPAGFELTFRDENQVIQRTRMVALNNGDEFSTFVSLLSPEEFSQLLGTGGTAAREWDHLQIDYPEYDLIDVRPSRLRVANIGCFRRN